MYVADLAFCFDSELHAGRLILCAGQQLDNFIVRKLSLKASLILANHGLCCVSTTARM